MQSRGDIKRLWVGVLIALPSGAGVALSVLGGNTGEIRVKYISATLHSLYNRFIGRCCYIRFVKNLEYLLSSLLKFIASLLPPAVNCGLLFAYAILSNTLPTVAVVHVSNGIDNESHQQVFEFQHRLRPNDPIINCSKYVNNNYSPFYSCNIAHEAAILGSCSLLLTIVNIICIIIMALIIFRIKEVVPLHQENDDIAEFFHHDVKIARDYNKNIQENESNTSATLATSKLNTSDLGKSIVNHWKGLILDANDENQRSSAAVQTNSSVDSTGFANLSELQMLAKDFDLNILNSDDREMTTQENEEKVLCLVNNLLDMYEESPPTLVDFCHYQSYDAQTSARKEQSLFYENVIEHLPPKWYDLLVRERRRRSHTVYSGIRRSNSCSVSTDQLPIRAYLNHSFNEQHEKTRTIQFQRKISQSRIKNHQSITLDKHFQETDDNS
jgi:hypothetical protein